MTDSAIIKLLIGVLLIIPGMLWYGFVLKILWNWFMPCLGLPVIGLVQAYGINLVVTIMVFNQTAVINDDSFWVTIFRAAFTPLLFLTVGYFVHLLI